MRLLDYLTGLISLLALPFIAWWGVKVFCLTTQMDLLSEQ